MCWNLLLRSPPPIHLCELLARYLGDLDYQCCTRVQFKTSLTWTGNMKTIKISNHRSSPLFFFFFSGSGEEEKHQHRWHPQRAWLHIPSVWGPSGHCWAASRSHDTHAEVFSSFSLVSLFQARSNKTCGRSFCAALWIQTLCQKSAGLFLSQDWRMQQGNRIWCPMKIHFSQKTSVCVWISLSLNWV